MASSKSTSAPSVVVVPEPTGPRHGEAARSRNRRAERAPLALVFYRELRGLTDSLRCRAMALLIVVLMVISGSIYATRHRAESAGHQGPPNESAERSEGMTLALWMATVPAAVKPSWKLAFLADDQQRRAPDVYRPTLDLQHYPRWIYRESPNPRLRVAEPIDWLFVLRVLVSMAAFVLGYDIVCGRRQRRLLRITLSYPIRRGKVLWAKLLALWTCLAVPFVAGAAVSLLLLVGQGGMRFSTAELAKMAGAVVLGLWAAAVFALLAILVSSRVSVPEHSLALLTLIWVALVIVVPGAGRLVAQTLRPLDTDQRIADDLDAIREDVESQHGGPGGLRRYEIARRDDFVEERRRAKIQNQIHLLQEEVLRSSAQKRLARAKLARDLGALSPMLLAQDVAERFIGSGLTRDRRFAESAWEFGDELAAWALEKDLRDEQSPRLLRDVRPVRMNDGRHIRFEPGFVSEEPIDLDQVPRFVFREQSVADGLRSALPRGALFAVVTALLWMALRVSFQYHDLGGTR